MKWGNEKNREITEIANKTEKKEKREVSKMREKKVSMQKMNYVPGAKTKRVVWSSKNTQMKLA